jgi:DNA-binding transcriptional ArsR family regulator
MKVKDYTVERKTAVSISVKYSSALDLLLSLWIIAETECGTPLGDLDVEEDFFNGLLEDLTPETKARLAPIPSGGTWISLVTLLPEAGDGQSIDEFLAFLAGYDPIDLRYKMISLYQDFDEKQREIVADAAEGLSGAVDQLLDLNAFSTVEAKAWRETLRYLLELEPSETRQVLVSTLTEVHEQAFKDHEVEFRQYLEEDYKSKRSMARRLSPERLVEIASNGISIEDRHVATPVVLMPSMVSRPWVVLAEAADLLIMAYPVSDRTLSSDPDAPPQWLVKLHKALGDERRLKILRRLAQGDAGLVELATEADVAKSTMHHHMMMLRAAGLVKVHMGGDKKYSLREETLPEAATYLNHYIHRSPETREESS